MGDPNVAGKSPNSMGIYIWERHKTEVVSRYQQTAMVDQ